MENFILLLMFQVIVIAAGQPVEELIDIDATSRNIAHRRVDRYPRTLKTDLPTCSLDQYFDKDEGRCSDVTGGGRVLYINSTNSCGVNVLQPHCTNTRYYYICKNNTTILAQCIQGQHFENNLQKCISVDSDVSVSSTVQPNLETYESTQLPECKGPGSFPVPDDCTLFYTCEMNGQQTSQSIFKCPKDMGYNPETKMCSFSSSCENINSDVPFCAPMIVKEEQNVEESTSIESSTYITDLDENDPVETTLLEVVAATSTVDLTTPNDRIIQTTETSMVVTENVDEELIPKATAATVVSRIAPVNLSTNSREIQSTEIEKNDSSLEDSTSNKPILNDEYSTTVTEKIVVTAPSTVDESTSNNANEEINNPILEMSPLKDFKLNKQSSTTLTKKKTVNVTKEAKPSSEKTIKHIGAEKNVTKIISTGTQLSKEDTNSEDTASSETTINQSEKPDEGTTDGIEQPVESSTAMLTTESLSELTTISLNENENNNILSTTDSYDANTKPTFAKNVDTNNESPVTKASTILLVNKNVEVNANDKSIVQDELLMIKTSKNVSNVSTALISNSESSTNTENLGRTDISSEPLNKHFLVTGKQNASLKENDITEKESVTALETTHSTVRVSTDVILPIMSAIFAIIDTLEQFFIYIFSKF